MPPARHSRAPARPRAVLYGRQSVEREESISIELQQSANREHCIRTDYDVVVSLEDKGISGKRWSNRPGAVEAVRMIEAREADVIVVWKWSRLSRNRLDLAVAFDRVETAGGRVESSTEGVDTATASGRLARGMLGEIAAFESERIGEGWKEAHASRRARGVLPTGGDRFGYRRVRDENGRTTGYEVDEDQAEALRIAYRLVIEGYGLHSVVRQLNDAGRTNLIGRPFHTGALYPLLDSGFAAGLVIQRLRDSTGRKTGEVVYHPGTHPAIVDGSTWAAYLAVRRARSILPPRSKAASHALSGLIRCADCGSAMVAIGNRRRTRRDPAYVCSRWRASGSAVARCVTITRPRAERIVREWLIEHAADVEAAAEADRTARKRHRSAATEARKARDRARKAESDLAQLSVLRARNEIAAAGYDDARVTLEAELERANAAADEADLAASAPPVESRSLAGRLVEGWDLWPTEDLNIGLRKMIRSVWVWPARGRGYTAPVAVVARWEPDGGAPARPDAS